MWSISTKEFIGDRSGVKKLRCVKLDWSEPDEGGRQTFREIPGSEFELAADLVLLSMGFVHVEHGPLVREMGLALDERGNLKVDADRMTSAPGIFAAGDAVLGASPTSAGGSCSFPSSPSMGMPRRGTGRASPARLLPTVRRRSMRRRSAPCGKSWGSPWRPGSSARQCRWNWSTTAPSPSSSSGSRHSQRGAP